MTNTDERVWIGFDLGGTKMLTVAFDEQLRPLARKRRKTKGHEGVKSGIERIVGTIERMLEASDIDPARIAGIGVGVPGPVDLERGLIVEAVNLGWKNVPLQEKLADALKRPVVLLNDVDAGVFGEHRFGAARGAFCVLGIFPGTGIGGGCVYDGQILRGRRMSSMEIGHIQINPYGERCGCGRYGCLETEASRLAISAAAAKAAFRGEAPNLLSLAGTDLSQIRSGVLAEAIRQGDAVVEDIVRRAGAALGRAAATIINLLLPDVIVLGGGLAEAMPKLLVESVTKSAQKTVMDSFANTFKVVAAELGDDAAALGAAAWAAKVFAGTETAG